MKPNGREEDVVIPDPDAVPRRLAQLGLTVELLREAVRRGVTLASFTTVGHPVFYPGVRLYSEINGNLRILLAERGWSLKDESNIPMAVSQDGSVVITAVRGNSDTGMIGRTPHTYRPRRNAGIRIIRRNHQLELTELLPPDQQVEGEPITLGPTWFLLYLRDGDTVRCEVSLATGISGAGNLQRWSERIILPEIDLLQPPPIGREDADYGVDVDVPVERRAS